MFCNRAQHLSRRETHRVAHLLIIVWTVLFHASIFQKLKDSSCRNVCRGEKSVARRSQTLQMLLTQVCTEKNDLTQSGVEMFLDFYTSTIRKDEKSCMCLVFRKHVIQAVTDDAQTMKWRIFC